jgi:hypothetical protein
VVVPLEHQVDAVLDQQRFERDPELNVRPMASAVGIQRVMEEADLPLVPRLLQRILDPGELLGIHLVAVEDEEAHVPAVERVIALAAHVEPLVLGVARVVVVAERSVEGDPGRQAAPRTAARIS